jgi:hypothetical protein
MQRLRSYQARQPTRYDKMITHLYQPQVTSSGITEFLPNPKTKFTDGGIFRRQNIFGIQVKPRLPARNVY